MMDKQLDRIQRGKNFVLRADVDRPLFGCYIGGWEGLNRYGDEINAFLKPGLVSADDIPVERFRMVYDAYRERLTYDNDDFVRCFEPLPSIPWAEAALGCPVRFTGQNFWSQQMGMEAFRRKLASGGKPSKDNPWIVKYGEFIDFLKNEYPDMPIGEAILRGSLDMLCAAVGEEETIFSMYDEPEFVHDGLRYCEDILQGLNDIQIERTPLYHGGNVAGMYHVFIDKPCFRIQQDAIALLNPDAYSEFIHESCVRLAAMAPRCLFHTHSTTNFVMDRLCQNPNVDIVQVTRDEGNVPMEGMLRGMETIQRAGKALLFKGRLTPDEWKMIRDRIDKRGLAVGAVVNSREEADAAMEYAKSLNW